MQKFTELRNWAHPWWAFLSQA